MLTTPNTDIIARLSEIVIGHLNIASDLADQTIVHFESEDEEFDAKIEQQDKDDDAKEQLRAAWNALFLLLDHIDSVPLLEQARIDFQKFDSDPLAYRVYDEGAYILWPSRMLQYIDLIRGVWIDLPTKDELEEGHSKLLSTIQNCETSLVNKKAFGWLPCGEDDVHQRIEVLLKAWYTDVRTKPPIESPLKNFFPDTGIRQLRALIEYKFLKSADQVQRLTDEILTDAIGYKSIDYDLVIFVIYETERFRSIDEWQHALRQAGLSERAKVLLLKGTPPTQEDYEVRQTRKTALDEEKSKKRSAEDLQQ